MRFFIAIIIIFSIIPSANANTDITCFRECLDKEYSYGFCKDQCSYDEDYQVEAPESSGGSFIRGFKKGANRSDDSDGESCQKRCLKKGLDDADCEDICEE